VQAHIRELRTIQALASDEEADLLQRIRGPRDEYWERVTRRLIEAYLPLVLSIAEKHSSSGTPMLDLIQEGNLGLMEAFNTFAANSTIPFSDYAASGIERAISEAITTSQLRPENHL